MWKDFLLATLLALFSINAMAEDAPTSYKVMSIKENISDDPKIVVKDQKNGVFVLAVGGWSGKFPKTNKMIRDMMEARGIKVTDDPSTADIGLQFANLVGFSFDDIEEQKNAVDGVKVILFLGGGVSSLFGSSDKATMVSMIFDTPLKITGRNALDGQNRRVTSTIIEYQTNKKGADVTIATFAAYIENFINTRFVFDTPTAPAVVASSAPAAASSIPVSTAAVSTPK